MTENKTFYNLISLSISATKNSQSGFNNAIVSSAYLNNLKLNIKELFPRMNILNLRSISLVIISTEVKKYETEIVQKEIDGNTITVTIYLMSPDMFFSLKTFDFFFNKNKNKSFEFFFAFKNMSWHSICSHFASTGVDISGGSNSRKHLISPIQHRLSLFLYCMFGSESFGSVNSSFHKSLENGDKKNNNFNRKKEQDLIIDFAKTQEVLKSRLLSDSPITEEFKSSYLNYINKINTSPNAPHGSNGTDASSSRDIIIEENSPSNNNNNSPIPNNPSNFKEGITRKFHTSAYLFDSKKSNDLTIAPIPTPLANEDGDKISNPVSKDKYKNSLISDFLGSIQEIVAEAANSSENHRQVLQNKFENTWINLIEENLKDDKFFINRHQSLLFKTLFSAKETLDTMAENNYLQKRFPQLGNELNKIEFIILTYSVCISLYSRLAYTALVVKVGEDILYLAYKNKFKPNIKSQKLSPKMTFTEYKESLNVNTTFYLLLGDFFVTILQQFPHAIFYRIISTDSFYSKEPYRLGLNNEYLDDMKKSLIVNPNTLPMLCVPTEWSETTHGGFLSNEHKGMDIITGSNEFAHTVNNKEPIYKAVNYLNSIKFGVNTNLLDYILSAEGSYILEMITPEDELQRVITLNVAQLYRNTYFYLNTHADWRGRLYTQSFYLSYQSGDLSSSLLNFWEGQPITDEGKVYLYIYGANSHNQNGISKASYADRLKWVKDNYDKIINLDRDLILSAESPFIFTAFCLNMRDIHNNPAAVINTPVFLDATCSGVQHLAALLKDLELGSHTNLIASTEDDRPGDLYDSLLDPINEKINNFGKETLKYGILSLVKLTRKEIKRSIMTKVYNVTVFGIAQQLQGLFKEFNNEKQESLDTALIDETLEGIQDTLENSLKSNKKKTKFICSGKDGKTVTLTKKEVFQIAMIINEQIFVIYPSLNSIYNYFIEISKISITLGIPLTWITPSGLEITQHYLKKKKKVISVSIFGKTKKMVFKENLNTIDKAKQTQAIIPNIIHSLDASHLVNLIKTASIENFTPLIPIHDCFGTLPNLMPQLETKVKKEFVLLYSQSKFLNDFHQRFIQNITDNQFEIIEKDNKSYVFLAAEEKYLEIPSIPELGALDLENILNSKYMIS